uniref:uncharacterized protein LOC122604601 n=1 Tax=Erigeron canadensis TaxID=72917 RepID=UPI001CB8A3B5|nr:uncharacterized protein LOC122604601 [Erigeron canadensis]
MIVQTEPGPFVQWIEDYPLPEGGLLKGMEMYDGKDDPDNHLKHFNGMIRMQKWKVPVACHMFALTLKDTARAWLDSLPIGSVTNFEDLKAKFRYIDETSLIRGLSENQRVSGFIHGLKYKALVEFLSMDLPETYTAATDKAHIFLTAQETSGNVRYAGGEDGRDRHWGKDRKNPRQDRGRSSPYPKNTHTPSTSHNILHTPSKQQRDVLSAEKPKPRSNMKGRDITKFCEYHGTHGHDTNDCAVLRGRIEEAVKTGKYSGFLKGIRESNQRQYKGKQPMALPDAKPEPLDEPINFIIAEIRHQENRIVTQEAWKSAAISFPPIEEKEASEAPIMISAVIGSHPVKRIYLDTGSSCEIMYDHCFQKLKSSLKQLKKDCPSPLTGFSGERSWSTGEITLPCTVGEGQKTRTKILNFVIVKAASPYNVALGRTAMRRLGIIASPIHAMAKLPTPYRVICIKSEAVTANQVSIVENRKTEGETEASKQVSAVEETGEKIFIKSEHPDQHILVGKNLPEEVKEKLKDLLKRNKDIFAWTPTDMTGVP